MERRIVVLAAVSQKQLENDGCDVEQECETIAQAKERAKYYLTEDYMNSAESTTMLGYAQVRVNGEVHSDFFGYTPDAQYSAQLQDEHKEYLVMARHGNG